MNVENQVKELTGVDIPILLESDNNNKGTIAIIAQDPLRSESDNNLPKDNTGMIIIGTPFAFHYQNDSYPETKVYREIVKAILDKGYKVYITDAHKIYPNIQKQKIDDKEREKLKCKWEKIGRLNKEQLLLYDELNTINDLKCVVTFGEEAYKYLKSPIFDNYTKVTLLHPSQQNWTNWKLWIYEQEFWGDNKEFWKKCINDLGNRTELYSSKKKNEENQEDSMINVICEITKEQIELELGKLEKDNC